MIIYKATNLINNKIYIGQTGSKLEERANGHFREARSEKARGVTTVHFHNAIMKYGFENFKWEIIDRADTDEDLNNKEIFWIAFYNSRDKSIGYNEAEGGKSGRRNQEVKDKISQKKILNWQDPIIAKKMRAGLEKATEAWQQKCKDNLVEKECQYCKKLFKIQPHLAKNRKYCSLECSQKANSKIASVAAAEANHERCQKRHSSFKEEVLVWAKNNKELILTCPKNKISTTLYELQEISAKYEMKDWRCICQSICGKNTKKALLEYLISECEKIC